MIARISTGVLDRIACIKRSALCKGTDVERIGIGVARYDRNIIRRNAEYLGPDDRHGGMRALPHVRQTNKHREPTVLGYLDEGRRCIVLEHTLGARCHSANADSDALQFWQLAVFLFPVGFLCGLFDAFFQATTRIVRAMQRRVTFFHRIHQIELNRVESKIARDRIHVLAQTKLQLSNPATMMKIVRNIIRMNQSASIPRGFDRIQRMQII